LNGPHKNNAAETVHDFKIWNCTCLVVQKLRSLCPKKSLLV